jgi:hypothetical protein
MPVFDFRDLVLHRFFTEIMADPENLAFFIWPPSTPSATFDSSFIEPEVWR